MVTCNPDICLIRMFFASQIQLHIPTDVPLICQFMASKGFVGDRLLTRQAKKKKKKSCFNPKANGIKLR